MRELKTASPRNKHAGYKIHPGKFRHGDIKCNEKIGSVIGIQQVTDTDELLAITSTGKIIRMRVEEISVIGRNTQGVRLVRSNENELIVSIAKFVE